MVNSADFIAPLEEGTPTDDLRRISPSPSAALPDQVKTVAVKHTYKSPKLYIETQEMRFKQSSCSCGACSDSVFGLVI